MVPIIWAFGSMLIVMIVLSFLPIGFTMKGKVLIVLVSFVLALGGIAAALVVPLWETALMLIALIFFASYIMEKRIGGALRFKEVVEDLNDDYEAPVSIATVEKANDKESLELQVLEVVEPFTMNLSETNTLVEQPIMEIDNQSENNILDSELSFLLERKPEEEVDEPTKDSHQEIGYLSEIESLLAFETEKVAEDFEDLHAEIKDFSKNDLQKLTDQLNNGADSLDDSLFDFLVAAREVASEKEDILEEIKPKEKLILQK